MRGSFCLVSLHARGLVHPCLKGYPFVCLDRGRPRFSTLYSLCTSPLSALLAGQAVRGIWLGVTHVLLRFFTARTSPSRTDTLHRPRDMLSTSASSHLTVQAHGHGRAFVIVIVLGWG